MAATRLQWNCAVLSQSDLPPEGVFSRLAGGSHCPTDSKLPKKFFDAISLKREAEEDPLGLLVILQYFTPPILPQLLGSLGFAVRNSRFGGVWAATPPTHPQIRLLSRSIRKNRSYLFSQYQKEPKKWVRAGSHVAHTPSKMVLFKQRRTASTVLESISHYVCIQD